MRILISGASGLVGSALQTILQDDGHTIARLVRPETRAARSLSAEEVRWNPATAELDARAAENADAVVNLAGESVASGRWTIARKDRIRSSRVMFTRDLVVALSTLQHPPKIFVSASAVGYYGDRGEELLTEQSPAGDDFLARLAQDWEAAAAGAATFGARTVMLRFGVILSSHGGALRQMLTPFRLGLGGRLGTGQQWMSWIALSDAVELIRQALSDARWAGPLNAVSPHPVRNAEFTAALARILRRPAILPVPGWALHVLLGEMADALLLCSQRVMPKTLNSLGYGFRHPALPAALEAILKPTAAPAGATAA